MACLGSVEWCVAELGTEITGTQILPDLAQMVRPPLQHKISRLESTEVPG